MDIELEYKIEYCKNNPRMEFSEMDKLIKSKSIKFATMQKYVVKSYWNKMRIANHFKPTVIKRWLANTFNMSMSNVEFIVYDK